MNPYYIGQSAAQLRAALADDIAALYAAVGSAGTVTSVGLASTDLTVSGSPVTTSGSITANLAAQPGVSGSYTYAALTINGKGVITAAASGAAPAASANPSASIGLAAINGGASTYLRSDAAPALSQAIVPTWTGLHTFQGAVGAAAIVIKGATTGASSGLVVDGGNASSNFCAIFRDSTITTNFLLVYGDGGVTIGTPTGADLGLGTLNVQNQLRVGGIFGINGAVPAAQPTGYGTPTGGAHQLSFAAGSITLPNLAAAVAQLIIELKAYGLIGA